MTMICRCCGNVMKMEAGDLTPRMIASGRKQRYFLTCRNKACAMHDQTLYVLDEADYQARDLSKYGVNVRAK